MNGRAQQILAKLALEKWLSTLSHSFADRILPVDLAVADEWGRMSAKRPVSTVDALLAATAKVHQMMLATRNVADVADLEKVALNVSVDVTWPNGSDFLLSAEYTHKAYVDPLRIE